MPASRRYAAPRMLPNNAIAVFGGSGGVGSEVSTEKCCARARNTLIDYDNCCSHVKKRYYKFDLLESPLNSTYELMVPTILFIQCISPPSSTSL